MRFAYVPLISLLAIASAAPKTTRSSSNPINSLACAVVTDVISALKGYPPYSTFCSSFLGITTRTTSVTVTQSTTSIATATVTTTSTSSTTVTTVVPQTATSTSTSTSFTTSVSTVTSTITSTSTTTVPVTSTSVSTLAYTSGTVTSTSTVATTRVTAATSTTTVCPDPSNKPASNGASNSSGSGRLNRRMVTVPACVKSWSLPLITTACECLSLPTPVSTSTIYSTSSITQTTTTTATAKTTTTLTASAYTTASASTVIVITSTIASTTTVFTTTIVTSTVQSTVTAASVTSSGVLATTTTSVTFTATSTPVATATACPAPSACSNQGLQYAYYPSPFGANLNHGYNFDPTYFKPQTPRFSGATTNVGFDYGDDTSQQSFYGSQAALNDRYALTHRGYIYASVTGVYTITVSGVDDIVDVWTGPIAYSGWTRNNALAEALFFSSKASASASISLTAGTYNYFRFVFGQGDGEAAYSLGITDPNGKVLLSSNTTNPGYIVQYSCDGTTAPPYQPFGQET